MSGPSDASGVCVAPGYVRSAWISSAATRRSCSTTICATASSSLRLNDRPQGLCGLHQRSSRASRAATREGVDVERAALLDRPKASFDDPPVVVGDRAEEGRVDRRGDEHTVAGLGERDDRVDHAAHDVGELEPERGVGLPAEPPTEAASTEGLDRVGALVDRIAVVARPRDRDDRLSDRRGDREVHLRDPRRAAPTRDGAATWTTAARAARRDRGRRSRALSREKVRHVRKSRASCSHMSAERRSDSTSIRSSLPWNRDQYCAGVICLLRRPKP